MFICTFVVVFTGVHFVAKLSNDVHGDSTPSCTQFSVPFSPCAWTPCVSALSFGPSFAVALKNVTCLPHDQLLISPNTQRHVNLPVNHYTLSPPTAVAKPQPPSHKRVTTVGGDYFHHSLLNSHPTCQISPVCF